MIPAPAPQRTELFDFHSAFWMNLHHYLHASGRATVPLVASFPAEATVDERARWSAAVETYRARYGKRSLVFDEGLVRMKLQLTTAESAPSLSGSGISDEDCQTLEAVAPIYRKYWWPSHDAANRAFVGALQSLLKQYGSGISARLAATYGNTWPAQPIRVDLVHDAGPPGNAYTTNDPTHITVGSADERHRGVAVLEIVFHEASHGWDDVLSRGVVDAAKRLGVPAPPQLWHALLFFNAGTIVTEALAAGGVRDYQMYMEKQKMFDGPYRGWREPIVTHWTAFLAGKISRDEAIELILKGK
jgi:hypothetical protein